jgi:hypothetical protein
LVVVVVVIVVIVVVVVEVVVVVIQTATVSYASDRPSHVTCHAPQALLSMNTEAELNLSLRDRVVNVCSTAGDIAHGKSSADGHDAGGGGLKRVYGCKVRLSHLEAIL